MKYILIENIPEERIPSGFAFAVSSGRPPKDLNAGRFSAFDDIIKMKHSLPAMANISRGKAEGNIMLFSSADEARGFRRRKASKFPVVGKWHIVECDPTTRMIGGVVK